MNKINEMIKFIVENLTDEKEFNERKIHFDGTIRNIKICLYSNFGGNELQLDEFNNYILIDKVYTYIVFNDEQVLLFHSDNIFNLPISYHDYTKLSNVNYFLELYDYLNIKQI